MEKDEKMRLHSTNPQLMFIVCFPSLVVYSTFPTSNEEMIGAWSLRISNEPRVPETNTLSTSPWKTDNEHQRRIRRMQEKRSKPLCGSII